MKPVRQKRVQLYFGFRNGFLIIGPKPKGYWVLAGGRLARRRKKQKGEAK